MFSLLVGVWYLQHSDLQRDVEHFFGASDELQTVEGIAIGLQGIFLLSELKQRIKYVKENTP